MAPEIIEHRAHGTAADVWAFGVCLFVLLFDRFPFRSETPGKLLADITANTHRPTTARAASGISELFDQLFATDPAERPTTAQLMKTCWFASDPLSEATQASLIS